MYLKIRGGTARNDHSSLCLSCRHATVVRGASLRDEIVQCARLSDGVNRITFPVTSCSGHVDRMHATISEMEETAWILRSDPRRNEVGFVKASSLKPRDRYVLSEDW